MKLTTPYTLRVTGDPAAFLRSPRDRKTLAYLLERLFAGEEVDEGEFEAWGLRVTLADEFVAVPRLGE